MSAVRVMIWVQHLLGIGHQRRAALIAKQLHRLGAEVCYVSGGYPLKDLDTGAAARVQLPPTRAADAGYKTLLDGDGRPVSDAWRRARRRALLAAFDDFRPAALITESYPFGRGLLRFELEPLLDRVVAARPRVRLICSVRDIVQPRGRKRNEGIAALVRSRFDAVLVHSDPGIVDFGASFPQSDQIHDRIRYTGYVSENAGVGGSRVAGEGVGVLVSGGGGVVAERLLETALLACPLSDRRHEPWRLLAGPGIGDAAFERLQHAAGNGIRVERNRSDFSALLEACRVSVSQGGYNTLLDVVTARARGVVVPFSEGDQSEQPTRARLFAQKNLIQAVLADPTPADLAAAVDAAAAAPRPPAGVLDLNGAERSAEIVLELARKTSSGAA